MITTVLVVFVLSTLLGFAIVHPWKHTEDRIAVLQKDMAVVMAAMSDILREIRRHHGEERQ